MNRPTPVTGRRLMEMQRYLLRVIRRAEPMPIGLCPLLIGLVLLLLAPIVQATAIQTLLDGTLAPDKAFANLIANGSKLGERFGTTFQENFAARKAGAARTWTYAAALKTPTITSDSTLVKNPDGSIFEDAQGYYFDHPLKHEASSVADSMRLTRKAHADAQASKLTGISQTNVKTNFLAVAKAVASTSVSYKAEGAKAGAIILSAIAGLVLDPLPPGAIDPDSLQGDVMFDRMDFTELLGAAGFDYEMGIVDPNGRRHVLRQISGEMYWNTTANNWDLRLNDSAGIMSRGHFSPLLPVPGEPEAMQFVLNAPFEIEIPFLTNCSTGVSLCLTDTLGREIDAGSWGANEEFFTFTDSGVIARSTDNALPSPSTLTLLAVGLAGLGFFAGRRP